MEGGGRGLGITSTQYWLLDICTYHISDKGVSKYIHTKHGKDSSLDSSLSSHFSQQTYPRLSKKGNLGRRKGWT